MIRDLKSLYVAILDNEVVFFDTNLKLFVEKLNNLESDSRNYDHYYREFKKSHNVVYKNSKGVGYHLQKLL